MHRMINKSFFVEENDPFYCEACNRSWKTAEELQEHISEHEVCGREGCTFAAHPKIVALHVQFHHFTGIYKKIANVQSPEEIAKWIAERKSRYPTDANVALRVAKEKEMIERGERVEENNVNRRNNRQNKGDQKSKKPNWRERRSQRNQTNVENKSVPKRHEVISDDENEDPKKDWNGNLPPFQGLSCLSSPNKIDGEMIVQENSDNCVSKVGSIDSTDEDPKEDCSSSSALNVSSVTAGAFENEIVQKEVLSKESESKLTSEAEVEVNPSISPTASTVNLNSSISSNDVESNQAVSDQTTVCHSSPPDVARLKLVPYDVEANDDSEDSGPEECAYIKTTEKSEISQTEVTSETLSESTTAATESTAVNNFSETSESVKNTKSRKRQRHRGSLDKGNDSEKDFVKKQTFVRNKKLTLLEKLLSKEIRHERNVILQCVHYVVSNNFFDNDKQIDVWIDSDSDSDCSFD